MNEQIRKLAEQAAEWASKAQWSADPKFGDRSYSELYNEKFAELIVLRCSLLCEVIGEQAQLTTSGETARKTKATAESCAYLIKLSFGVEE